MSRKLIGLSLHSWAKIRRNASAGVAFCVRAGCVMRVSVALVTPAPSGIAVMSIREVQNLNLNIFGDDAGITWFFETGAGVYPKR